MTGPRLRWRRLRVLVEHLPPDSALSRSALGEKARWGIAEQLLAALVHVGEMRLYQAADSKKRGRPPKPMPTPWTRSASSGASDAEVARRLRDLAERERLRQSA